MADVAVIGTGYVGLTTGACLARLGHQVTCADVVPEKIDLLNAGRIPIFEPGLEDVVREGVAGGRLRFVLGADAAVPDAEFVFVCLPTPQGDGGAPDMSYIEACARAIGPLLRAGAVVVNKSTVPVGSTSLVGAALGRDDVAVVACPEFMRQGSAVQDCLHPDRIVIGCEDQAAGRRVASLYDALDAPILVTDPVSAETIKYASNAFLATKVSFANAMANLCEAVGADVREVVQGMGYDRRIGFDFLRPGPGWGGSCLPKDTTALVRIGEDAGYDFALLKTAVAVNEEQHQRVADKIVRMAGGSVDGKTVAVWGLAFKARTDDVRESPSLRIVDRLIDLGGKVKAYDPAVTARVYGVDACADPYAACEDAAVLAVLTDWDEFRQVDLAAVFEAMEHPGIVDARNLLEPDSVRRLGFRYDGVGRG